MPKKKEQKKKERERRVARKKAAAALKRVQEKSAKEPETPFSQKKRGYSVETPAKPAYVDTSRKSPFTQRRSGG